MNYIKRTIILLILFVVVSPINSPKTITDNKYSEIQDDKFQLQPGDIIVTKGPVMWGFFGHCSIAIDDKTILQIEGPGDKPTTQSFESFKYNYASGKNDWIKFIVAAILVQVKKRLNGLRKTMKIQIIVI